MSKIKRKIAILIPAHNEEGVISQTLKLILQTLPKKDIFLVDDNSTDKTPGIAKKLLENVLSLKSKHGKAGALNTAISHFQLTKRYEYIFPIDADTKISPDFLNHSLKALDKDKKIVALVGKITGTDSSWVTAYRIWEYEIGQMIHKKAQDKEGAVIVCSGCTTVYRSSLLAKLDFPTDTLTEDMDMTFQIHRSHLGKISFCEKSVALTQDPLTLKDFTKQLDRWFTGYWQCVYKHKIPFGKQMLDFEVALSSIEGLLGGLASISLLFLYPWLILHNPKLLLTGLLIDFLLFFLPSLVLVSIKYKKYRILKFTGHFYLLRIFSSLVFLKAYIKTTFGADQSTRWNKATRYSFKGA